MLGIGFSHSQLFEQLMDARQELAIGYGADGLGVGVSSLSTFVIKGGTIDIPLVGIFSGQVEIAFVLIATHFGNGHRSGFAVAGFSDGGIEAGKAAMVGQATKPVDVADAGSNTGGGDVLDARQGEESVLWI